MSFPDQDRPMRFRLRDWLELCRVSNLPTVWVNAAAAGVLCGGRFPLLRGVLLLGGISMMYCGGICMNDWLDRHRDAVERPDRPLPSGRIAPAGAGALCLGLFCGALVLLDAAGGLETRYAGVLLLALILLYNLAHRRTVLAAFPMAACRFMIYPICGLAQAGTVSATLLAMALLQFCYILLLTLVARLEKLSPRLQRIRPMPAMLSGISLMDGIALAVLADVRWLGLGLAGAWATLVSQRRIRGD